jgi:hypothetical protein
MRGLADFFEDNGFARVARPGPAPRAGNEQAYWSLELEDPKGVSHVVLTKSLSQADIATCRQLKDAFLDIYNNTYSLQAVDVKEGEMPFKTPERPKKGKQ